MTKTEAGIKPGVRPDGSVVDDVPLYEAWVEYRIGGDFTFQDDMQSFDRVEAVFRFCVGFAAICALMIVFCEFDKYTKSSSFNTNYYIYAMTVFLFGAVATSVFSRIYDPVARYRRGLCAAESLLRAIDALKTQISLPLIEVENVDDYFERKKTTQVVYSIDRLAMRVWMLAEIDSRVVELHDFWTPITDIQRLMDAVDGLMKPFGYKLLSRETYWDLAKKELAKEGVIVN